MINPRKTHCKKGHKFTPKNEVWFTDINGKLQRKCKRCFNLRKQLRYRTDEAYREKMLAKSRKYKELKMKMKCIGGLSNGQIVEVEYGRHREGDQIRVPVRVSYELTSFQEDLKGIIDDTALANPYDYYQVCAIHWIDESKLKRTLFYLCPIKWNKFEALAYAIGA